MASRWALARTPFFFVGPRPYREAELAAYIRREHARGRNLAEILNDPYLDRHGSPTLLHAVLRRPDLLRAPRHDVSGAIRLRQAELRQSAAVASLASGREAGRISEDAAPENGRPRQQRSATPHGHDRGG